MKTIYVVQPYTTDSEAAFIFQNSVDRVNKKFDGEELDYAMIMPFGEEFDKQILAIREFLDTLLSMSNGEVILFFTGKFLEDPFCATLLTMCKMYDISAMLDEKIVVEMYKNMEDSVLDGE